MRTSSNVGDKKEDLHQIFIARLSQRIHHHRRRQPLTFILQYTEQMEHETTKWNHCETEQLHVGSYERNVANCSNYLQSAALQCV